jgi:hypothetical protein
VHGTSPFSPLSHNFRLSFPSRTLPLLLLPSRTISFGSIFSSKPSPAPPPHAVAHVARMEADANALPHDVEKQLALFQALSETNIQPGYELIINRWERMTEFVRSLLDNPEYYLLTLGLPQTRRTPLRHSFIQTKRSSITSRLFSKQKRKHRSAPQYAGGNLSLPPIPSLLSHLPHNKRDRLKTHLHQHKKQYPLHRHSPFPVANKLPLQSSQVHPLSPHLSQLPD